MKERGTSVVGVQLTTAGGFFDHIEAHRRAALAWRFTPAELAKWGAAVARDVAKARERAAAR